MSRFAFRFSLRVLLLAILLGASSVALWQTWAPWKRIRTFNNGARLSPDGTSLQSCEHSAVSPPKTGPLDVTSPQFLAAQNEIIVTDAISGAERWRTRWGIPGFKNDDHIEFSPCGQWVVSSFWRDSTFAMFFRTRDGKPPPQYPLYSVAKVDFSNDKKWIFILFSDPQRPAEILNAENGELRFVLKEAIQPPLVPGASDRFSSYFRDRSLFLSLSGACLEFSLETGALLATYGKDKKPYFDKYSANRSRVLTSIGERHQIQDVSTGKVLVEFDEHSSVELSEDARFLREHRYKTDSQVEATRLWDFAEGSLKWDFPGFIESNTPVSFDGKFAVTRVVENDVEQLNVWDVQSRKLRSSRKIPAPLNPNRRQVYFLRDDPGLALLCGAERLQLIRLNDCEVIASQIACDYNVSPDLRRVIAYDEHIFDMPSMPESVVRRETLVHYKDRPELFDTSTGSALFIFECELGDVHWVDYVSDTELRISCERGREIWLKQRDDGRFGWLTLPAFWTTAILLLALGFQLKRS